MNHSTPQFLPHYTRTWLAHCRLSVRVVIILHPLNDSVATSKNPWLNSTCLLVLSISSSEMWIFKGSLSQQRLCSSLSPPELCLWPLRRSWAPPCIGQSQCPSLWRADSPSTLWLPCKSFVAFREEFSLPMKLEIVWDTVCDVVVDGIRFARVGKIVNELRTAH